MINDDMLHRLDMFLPSLHFSQNVDFCRVWGGEVNRAQCNSNKKQSHSPEIIFFFKEAACGISLCMRFLVYTGILPQHVIVCIIIAVLDFGVSL